MKRKPLLFILCGLPFAGKTTLAKELTKRFGWIRVDLDQINKERGLGGLSNNDISDEDWQITYQESYERVDQGLKMGKTVVNDTANFTREQRDKLRSIAGKYNIPTTVIYVNVSNSEARQRWQQNRITSTRFDVTDEDFSEVADHFEVPTEDENVIYYDQSASVDEWIKNTLITRES